MPGVDILWGVEGAVSDGPPQYAYAIQYDYDVNGAVLYIGWALSSPTPGPIEGQPAITSQIPATGPLTSGAYWAIKKFTYNVNGQVTQVQWANGNTQTANRWDDRASLNYQ